MTCTSHTHIMRNPFAYQVHVKGTVEYQILTAKARNMRIAMISYSNSQRVLQMEGLGFTIDSTTYYNTVRHNRPSADDCQTIQGLLVALADAGFLWRSRVEYEEDPIGNVISQKFIQIFFMNKQQVVLVQRFVAGFVLVVDGTFNTNSMRLPLLIAVGITNSGKTFPVAFSYCPSERRLLPSIPQRRSLCRRHSVSESGSWRSEGGLIASLALIGPSLLFNYNIALTQLPIGNPDPVPKKVWRKKKVHGPADAAGLTSAEIAGKDLLAKEKAESAASRAANHGPEPADEEDPGLLPPSTAPPRLEESGSTKRTRGRTLDFVALHTGAASKKGKP